MYEYLLDPVVLRYPSTTFLQNQYVFSALILLIAAILAKLFLVVFGKYLQRFAKHTKTDFDDLILESVKRPFFYLILAQGLKLALYNLQINGVVNQIVDSLMALVFIFILARVLDIVIDVWGKTFAKKTKTKLDEVLLPLLHKFSKVVFVIVAIMWVLNIWNIDITPYLAGAGIAGIVIGLALQDALKNVLGGVSLILDGTYQVGDKIKIESGEVGEIVDIGLRSTKMRTYDNELLTIPNGYLANSRIQNYTLPNPKIRVVVDFGVGYGSNIDKVSKEVLKAIKKMDSILDDPEPGCSFVRMGDSALNFKALFWVDNWREAYSKKLEATRIIHDLLVKLKVDIPYPTQTIHLKK